MKNKHESKILKLFELITELIGWFEIMISPTLIGGAIGIIIYFLLDSLTGKIIGILVGFIGFLIGIIWATKIFKSKKGTIWFMSRVSATPELDQKEIDENDK